MPTYVYKKPNGETVELVMRIHEMLKRQTPEGFIDIGGQKCKRTMTYPGTIPPRSAYPIASEALAVNPSQIPEMTKYYRSQGISVEHTPDGRPLLRNQKHKKEVCIARGARDNDGGYGDKT